MLSNKICLLVELALTSCLPSAGAKVGHARKSIFRASARCVHFPLTMADDTDGAAFGRMVQVSPTVGVKHERSDDEEVPTRRVTQRTVVDDKDSSSEESK